MVWSPPFLFLNCKLDPQRMRIWVSTVALESDSDPFPHALSMKILPKTGVCPIRKNLHAPNQSYLSLYLVFHFGLQENIFRIDIKTQRCFCLLLLCLERGRHDHMRNIPIDWTVHRDSHQSHYCFQVTSGSHYMMAWTKLGSAWSGLYASLKSKCPCT